MRARNYTDTELLGMLKDKERDLALEYLCKSKEWRSGVGAMLRRNGSTMDKLDDLFTDGLVILERNIRTGKFAGKSSLKTYFLAICKNLLFTATRKTARIELHENPVADEPSQEGNPELRLISDEKRNLINKILERMGEPCKTILRMWSLSFSMPEIAEAAGLKDADNAKRRAYDCRKQMRTIVLANSNLVDALKGNYGKSR